VRGLGAQPLVKPRRARGHQRGAPRQRPVVAGQHADNLVGKPRQAQGDGDGEDPFGHALCDVRQAARGQAGQDAFDHLHHEHGRHDDTAERRELGELSARVSLPLRRGSGNGEGGIGVEDGPLIGPAIGGVGGRGGWGRGGGGLGERVTGDDRQHARDNHKEGGLGEHVGVLSAERVGREAQANGPLRHAARAQAARRSGPCVGPQRVLRAFASPAWPARPTPRPLCCLYQLDQVSSGCQVSDVIFLSATRDGSRCPTSGSRKRETGPHQSHS